ncbi:MAG: hypothetical protein IH585_10215 [Anaerolineaceae bacterium]|nr:hypothetical protein [Anaerolineaceae bacterium]
MKQSLRSLRLGQPAIYQIKLLGELGQEWASSFDQFQIEVTKYDQGPSIASLSGKVADQSALHGILNQIRDLGLVILLVKCISDQVEKKVD